MSSCFFEHGMTRLTWIGLLYDQVSESKPLYDRARRAVRFWGSDSAIEASLFVE